MNSPLLSVSACLVVYNEEAVIGRCLESLRGAVSEIILVHDGPCSDRTLEIAKTFGAKIFERHHIGEAEQHRVFTFEQATGEWCLYIDADEYLSEELRAAIPALTSSTEVDGYEVIWPFWDGTHEITTNWPYRPVLFRRSTMTFFGLPHEPMRSTGKVVRVPLTIKHRPTYNNFTFTRFRTKWLKWAKIQAEDSLKLYTSFPRFHLPDQEDWSPRFRFARDHAYLFPLFGLYAGLQTLRGGAYRAGYPGFRQALMWGGYTAAVYYYIWQLQHTGKKKRRA